MRLANKTALITGAASGIGKATALRLAAEGAAVGICDINGELASQVADGICAAGGQAMAAEVDVRNSEQVSRMVADMTDQYGRIDILVNNAGGAARLKSKPFHESGLDLWNWIIDVNLVGAMICTRAVINQMMDRRSGKIINLASIAGVIGAGGGIEYAAAKGGIIAMTKSLAKAYGSYGINVNCLSPGAIATEGVMAGRPDIMRDLVRTTFLGRAGQADEVASLILFLASEEAAFITGQNIIIDGGKTLAP